MPARDVAIAGLGRLTGCIHARHDASDASCTLISTHHHDRFFLTIMATGWDDDFDAPMAGPSFVDRARVAPDDDDFPILEGGRPGILPQDLAEETPFQQLIRHWMNERHAPDILPGQEALLGRLLDHIRKQVSNEFLWGAMWLARRRKIWLRTGGSSEVALIDDV